MNVVRIRSSEAQQSIGRRPNYNSIWTENSVGLEKELLELTFVKVLNDLKASNQGYGTLGIRKIQ